MKKRILAMLLTVCMLVLSVPMFVLPAAAEEEPVYTTSFNSTTNMPKPEDFVANGVNVEWLGGWQFVGYNKWGFMTSPLVGASQWCAPQEHANWGGHITAGGRFCGMNWGNTNKDKYGSIGSLMASDLMGTPSDKGGAAALRYTAEKTGTLNIYFDKLGNDAKEVAGTFTYALYIDNEKVDEWTLTKAAGEEKWIFDTKTLVAEGVELRKGTYIEFVCTTTNIGEDKAMNGGNCLFPTIEYTETADNYETAFPGDGNANLPTVEADGSIAFHGNWSYWQYQKENNNGAGFYNTDWRYKVVTVQSEIPVAGYIASQWFSGGWGAGMQVSNSHANQAPALGSMSVSSAISSVLRYEAEKSGTVDIILNQVGVLSGHADFSQNNVRFGIFVNGTMVWPVAGGTLNNVDALPSKVMSNVEAVLGLNVTVGDHIEFIVEGYKQNLNNTWGGAGNVMFPTISYRKVHDSTAIFDNATNLPVINEDKTVTFNGGFIPVGYEKGEEGYDYSDPEAALVMDIQSSLWGAGQGIAPTAPHLAWANKAHMVIKDFNANYFNQKGQIAVTGTMAGGLRYVAQDTGVVKIDFAQLGNNAPRSAGIAKFTYFVYVNGEKIFETKGADWGDVSLKKNVPVAENVKVKLGDVIDFIVEGDVGAADPWGGSGNILYPAVAYTSIVPKATASANIALGSNFALNAKVEIPVSVQAITAKVGLLVNGEEATLTKTGDTTYAIYNILKAYAQDLAAEKVTIQPYYVTTAGETIWGNESTTNILSVLQAYVTSEDKATADLAKATLNYVAEAQKYFDPSLTADQLANAILGDKDMSYRDLVVTGTGAAVVIDNKKATASFSGVSMVLNNAIAMKLHIALPEGADIKDYKLEVIELATQDKIDNNMFDKGAATATIQLKNVDAEGNAVAYIGTTFENMDRVYQFRVLDAKGKVVSDTVAYSPLAYATRMANDIEVGYVCKALIAMNDAITAYAAAR